MKKVFATVVLTAVVLFSVLVSCTKERADEPRQKSVYKTYYFRVDGVEDGGTYSSPIGRVTIKQN